MTSYRAARSSYAAWAAAARCWRPSSQSPASTAPPGWPISTTWLRRSLPGLSSTGFIALSGVTRAASACTHWARPISAAALSVAPSAAAHTIELLDMFWALYGATRTPRRANARHRPVVTTLFPESEVVPATSSPLTGPTNPPAGARYRRAAGAAPAPW